MTALPYIIKGEKTFTLKVRGSIVRAFIRLAENDMKEAARHRDIARAILEASTREELEKIRLTIRSGEPCLLKYLHDDRTVCYYCKRKEFGGGHLQLLTGEERFHCWRSACHEKWGRDVRKDRKAHPKLYAAELKRSKRRRRDFIGRGRIRRGAKDRIYRSRRRRG